jgi:hypothetical protein
MSILNPNIKFFLNLLRGIPSLNLFKLRLFVNIFFLKIKISKKKKLNYDDIFIVTSCINHLDLDNINYNSKHSPQLRLNELIETIKSIKVKFKTNYKIIVCENSKINKIEKDKILAHADQILDISNKKLTILSRKINNKGVPWCVSVLFSCNEIINYHYRRLHFVTGRYKLNNKFNLLNFKNNKLNFRFYKEHNNVSTRYFCYSRNDLIYFFNLTKKVLYICLFEQPAENGIAYFSKFKHYIYGEIGIEGKVNGITFISE